MIVLLTADSGASFLANMANTSGVLPLKETADERPKSRLYFREGEIKWIDAMETPEEIYTKLANGEAWV